VIIVERWKEGPLPSSGQEANMGNHQIEIAKLYEEFSTPLKAFIQKRVSDPAVAEDLLHDVFLKIHNQMDSLKQKEKLAPWIYRVTQNSIIDFYRKRKEFVPAEDDFIASEKGLLTDAAERLSPTLKRLSEQLPPVYKEALFLADFEGVKQTEIASRLGLSVSATKSRVQRARKMLKELLLECCHFEFDRYGTVFDYHPKNCKNCCGHAEAGKDSCKVKDVVVSGIDTLPDH
jgi:RNA polymerase sigma-70 factor (ECF subfamily)